MQARRAAASLKLINLLRGRCIKKSELRTGYLSQRVERRVKSDPASVLRSLPPTGGSTSRCVCQLQPRWIVNDAMCSWQTMCSHQALYQVCAPNKVTSGAQQTLVRSSELNICFSFLPSPTEFAQGDLWPPTSIKLFPSCHCCFFLSLLIIVFKLVGGSKNASRSAVSEIRIKNIMREILFVTGLQST